MAYSEKQLMRQNLMDELHKAIVNSMCYDEICTMFYELWEKIFYGTCSMQSVKFSLRNYILSHDDYDLGTYYAKKIFNNCFC